MVMDCGGGGTRFSSCNFSIFACSGHGEASRIAVIIVRGSHP